MPDIDFADKKQKANHDEIVNLVRTLLILHKDGINATLQTEKQKIENKISFIENKIDEIVYSIYGLQKQEIELLKEF